MRRRSAMIAAERSTLSIGFRSSGIHARLDVVAQAIRFAITSL